MRRIAIHPLVLAHAIGRRAFERKAAGMRIADAGFDVAEGEAILVHAAGPGFALLAGAEVESEGAVGFGEGQVAERGIVCRRAGVDPYTAFLAGAEAVAVYACRLYVDFGAPEVAADEGVGYGV